MIDENIKAEIDKIIDKASCEAEKIEDISTLIKDFIQSKTEMEDVYIAVNVIKESAKNIRGINYSIYNIFNKRGLGK